MPSLPLASSPLRLNTTPTVSSPLSPSNSPPTSPTVSPLALPRATRSPQFPTSRPLRPFPSIANNVRAGPGGARRSQDAAKSPKLIEPPQGFQGTFFLNLTQAEFSRQ